MRTDTDRKKAERDRKRAEGLVERAFWVRPELVDYIRAIVEALNRAFERKGNKE